MDSERQKILIVDDERVNREILSNLLEEAYSVLLAKSGKQALERIAANPDIDLVLLDVMMPEMDGYETIKLIKAKEESNNIPIIFITGLNSADDEKKGLKLGAADYITKPFHPAIVQLRVENHLQFMRQRKVLETIAGRDGLTEIANRRSFDAAFSKEWLRSLRNGAPLSVAMIDVDFFKPYNDNYGHAKGDVALKFVANVLNTSVRRGGDIVARYGGEEFVVLLPETSAREGKSFLNEIRQSVFDLQIPHEFSSASPYLTVSIGGSTTGSHKSPEELLRTADSMLYKSKNNGRNMVYWE